MSSADRTENGDGFGPDVKLSLSFDDLSKQLVCLWLVCYNWFKLFWENWHEQFEKPCPSKQTSHCDVEESSKMWYAWRNIQWKYTLKFFKWSKRNHRWCHSRRESKSWSAIVLARRETGRDSDTQIKSIDSVYEFVRLCHYIKAHKHFPSHCLSLSIPQESPWICITNNTCDILFNLKVCGYLQTANQIVSIADEFNWQSLIHTASFPWVIF